LLNKVLEDATRLEDPNLLAVSKGICYGRYAAIWVDLEEPVKRINSGLWDSDISIFTEPWLFLAICRDVDVFNLVRLRRRQQDEKL